MRTPALVWAFGLSVGLHVVFIGRLPASTSDSEGDQESSLWSTTGSARPGAGAPLRDNTGRETPDAPDEDAPLPVDLVASDPQNQGFPSEGRPSKAEDPAGIVPPPSKRSGGERHRARPEASARSPSAHMVANRGGPGTAGPAGPGEPGQGGDGDGDGTGGGPPTIRGMTLPLLRVLPIALSANSSFNALPFGRVGSLELEFSTLESGRARLEHPLPSGVKPEFRALVDQILRLLEWPRYAVRSAELSEGTDRVRLTMVVTQDTASAELLASSGGAYGLGADPPSGRKPGKAHCTWANGHRIEVTLERMDR